MQREPQLPGHPERVNALGLAPVSQQDVIVKTIPYRHNKSLIPKGIQGLNGAACQIRTDDLMITNQLLYQLS